MVEWKLPKLKTGVRFSSPAPFPRAFSPFLLVPSQLHHVALEKAACRSMVRAITMQTEGEVRWEKQF